MCPDSLSSTDGAGRDCVCGGTGLVTRLTAIGDTGPEVCSSCFVPRERTRVLEEALTPEQAGALLDLLRERGVEVGGVTTCAEPLYSAMAALASLAAVAVEDGGKGESFVLPGTTEPATCAICGARLVADENRETGWRCPREREHEPKAAGTLAAEPPHKEKRPS